MYTEVWGATDRGRVRRSNQDAFLLDPDLGLSIVADGVGGQARGEVASALACRVVREHLHQSRADLFRFQAESVKAHRREVTLRLREAVQMASSQVFRAGEALTAGRGMSCTLEVLVLLGETAFIAHVGDSRTYLVREGACHQLTEDHSVLQEKVRRGQMTQEEADRAPGKNVITRAVGIMPAVKVDTLVFQVIANDTLLQCSDGVTRYVSAPELAKLLRVPSALATEKIVGLCNARGGADNITAAVCAVRPGQPTALTGTMASRLRRFAAFESATERELAVIESVLDEQLCRPGKLLFRETEPGHDLYLVLDGEVTITRAGQPLCVLGAGDAFGEMALFDEPQRSATAIVTRPTHLLVMRRHRFTQLVFEHEGLGAHLLQALATRMSAVIRSQNVALVPGGSRRLETKPD